MGVAVESRYNPPVEFGAKLCHKIVFSRTLHKRYIPIRCMKIKFTRKGRLISLLLLLIFSTQAYAQTCNTVFQQIYGGNGNEEGHAVIYTPDQNMIIAGKSTSGSAGGYDGLLMKLSDKGDLLWNHVIGGAKDDDLVRVKQTADNGFIAIGQTRSAGNDKGDIWVIKIDAGGIVTWSRYYRTTATEGAAGKDIIELSTGGYAMVANVNDSTAQGDGLVVRLDAAGAQLWMRRFDNGQEDGFYALTEMNGELIVGGYATVDLKDALVMKLDVVSGDVKWAQLFTWHAAWNEEVVSINRMPAGGIAWIMKGHDPTAYSQDAFEIETIKMDAAGKLYGGTRTGAFTGGANASIKHLVAQPTTDGGYIFVCDDVTPNQGMPTLGKLHQNGRKEWMRSYLFTSGPGNFYGVAETGTKGYVCTGTIQRFTTFLSNKIFIVKTDPVGMNGSCSPYVYGGNDGNTDTLPGDTFSWSSSLALTPVTGIFTPQVNSTPFTLSTICKKDYCDPTPPVSNSDACTTAFFTELKEKFNVDQLDQVRTVDGDVVTVGQRYYYWTHLAQVIKLKPDGTVRWAKQVNPAPGYMFNGHTWLNKVITTKDNNLLVAGYDYEIINNGVAQYGLITKMDLNGNVLWARRIAQLYDTRIVDVKLTEDGGFLIIANGDYGNGGARPLIVRTDATGNVVWQTELNYTNVFFRTLAYSPDGVYVGLDFYLYWNAHIEICKLDPKTGNLVWVKHFAKTDETRITNLGIERIKDTLFIGVGLQKESTLFNYTFNTALLKLKESNGQQLGAFRLSTPNMATPTDIEYINSDRAASFFIKTADDAFAIAKECITNKDTIIQLTKFSSNGHIAWSRNYPNLKRRTVRSVRADGMGMLITGILGGMNDINEESRSGFIMRVNEKGEIEGSTTGNCANVPATATTSSVTFTEDVAQITGNGTSAYGPVTSSGKSMAFVPSFTLAYPSCTTPSLCNTLNVTGDTKFCGQGQTAIYTATKNSGCDMPITWQVDTAVVTIVETTATTLKVQFKKYGNTSITALLDAGCKIIKGTASIAVNKAAGELDLGPDTVLCAGSTYQLDADKDFQDFLWQDGSTSQTYNVTTPGVYRVMVTDICNKTAVDEVSITAAPLYAFSLGADIEKCKETAVTLNIPAGFTNYTWNTDFAKTEQDGKVTLSPDRDTTYILTAEKGTGCAYKDTLQVKILTPAAIDLGADKAICENDSLQLTVAGAFTNVRWGTGETGPSVFVKTPGLYAVSAIDAQQCISADTMELLSPLPLPVVSLVRDPVICVNAIRMLNAGNAGTAYLWSTGETTSSISVNEPGNWWVRVTGNNGCVATDTASIKELAPLPHDFLPLDTPVCKMGTLELFPAETYNTYNWSTGANTRQLTVSMPGTYWLEVTDKNGCTGRDTVQVAQKECLKGLYMPTVFSPNGDGVNDLLRPVLMGKVVKYKFSVYNRWGSAVFESSELQQGWDGNLRGHMAPTGGYVWICTYQLQGETQQVGKGAVLLIR